MVLVALKRLFYGSRLRREEMTSKRRKCGLNGTNVNAVINEATLCHRFIQRQFLPAFRNMCTIFISAAFPTVLKKEAEG
jgi:hypothetical protein